MMMPRFLAAAALLGVASLAPGAAAAQAVPAAPIRAFWPDPAFDPSIQCRGNDASLDVQALLPRARVAMRVPGTESVEPDPSGRCIRVVARDLESGRFAALIMRGVGVPRRAVLLELADPGPAGRGWRGRSGPGA